MRRVAIFALKRNTRHKHIFVIESALPYIIIYTSTMRNQDKVRASLLYAAVNFILCDKCHAEIKSCKLIDLGFMCYVDSI